MRSSVFTSRQPSSLDLLYNQYTLTATTDDALCAYAHCESFITPCERRKHAPIRSARSRSMCPYNHLRTRQIMSRTMAAYQLAHIPPHVGKTHRRAGHCCHIFLTAGPMKAGISPRDVGIHCRSLDRPAAGFGAKQTLTARRGGVCKPRTCVVPT